MKENKCSHPTFELTVKGKDIADIKCMFCDYKTEIKLDLGHHQVIGEFFYVEFKKKDGI